MPSYTVAANTISQPIYIQPGSIITVSPASGTVTVESTTGDAPAVFNGVAAWRSWSKGPITAETADLWNEAGYLRVTAGIGAVIVTVNPNPTMAQLDGYRRDWGGTRSSPIILSQSAVAVSVTGTLTETTLATVTIPGGMMGPNGTLRITPLFTFTNSANTKTPRVKFGAAVPVAFYAAAATTASAVQPITNIRNRGPASQIGIGAAFPAGIGSTGTSTVTSSIDTAVDQTVTITGQLTNTGETITLEGYTVEVLPS